MFIYAYCENYSFSFVFYIESTLKSLYFSIIITNTDSRGRLLAKLSNLLLKQTTLWLLKDDLINYNEILAQLVTSDLVSIRESNTKQHNKLH